METKQSKNILRTSQAYTQTESNDNTNQQLSFKQQLSPIKYQHNQPQEDPDQPPQLSLENQCINSSDQQPTNDNQCYKLQKQRIMSSTLIDSPQQIKKIKRNRARSQDNCYSILGFISNKIRIRLLSEEITEKLEGNQINTFINQ